MKANHKILYSCGNCDSGDFSHRLLLVRRSGASDSWKSYLYDDATGEQLYASQERGIDQAERIAQLYALNHGVSPILSNVQHFPA